MTKCACRWCAESLRTLKTQPWSTADDRRRAVELYLAGGKTMREIGAMFGRSRMWVSWHLREAGVVTRAPHRPERRPGLRRLQVDEVIRRLRAGETQRSITRALGFQVSALVYEARVGKVNLPELLEVVGPARKCVRRAKSC